MFEEQFENQQIIYHSCDCYPDCKGRQCPCFYARQQRCQKDSCCQTCIQMKNAMMLADRGEYCTCKNTQCLKSYCKCFQFNAVCTSLCQCQGCQNKIDSVTRWQAMQNLKNNPIFETQRKYCTCKKIKCDKKYCSCFANGIKCTKFCSCENCTNCDIIINDMEEQRQPSFINEEDLQNIPLPQRMSFQSIRFSRNSKNSWNSRNSRNSKN